jgi:hypothetical protein
MRPRRIALPLALVVGVLLTLLAGSVAQAARPTRATLYATLQGFNEPGGGDPNGFGTATVSLNADAGRVCWVLRVNNISTPVAAHIHAGADEVVGPVVVPFSAPVGGYARGCLDGVNRDLIRDIISHPSSYYVNVHSTEYPPGAIRGQLLYYQEAFG